MVKLVNEVQPRNASRPSSVTDSGMVKLVKELQPEKALSPIQVTDSGITSRNKYLQCWKACGWMDVILVLGMRTSRNSFTVWPNALTFNCRLDIEDNLQIGRVEHRI